MDMKKRYTFLINKIQSFTVSVSNTPQSKHFVLYVEVTNSILKNVVITRLSGIAWL